MILKRIRSPTKTQRSLCKNRDFPGETVDLIVVTASVARTVYHNRPKNEKEILSMASLLKNKNIPFSTASLVFNAALNIFFRKTTISS